MMAVRVSQKVARVCCDCVGDCRETSLLSVQILAHHPDFPTRQDAAEEGVAVYQPFSRMLQFALEPLILAASGSEHAEPPGEAAQPPFMAGTLCALGRSCMGHRQLYLFLVEDALHCALSEEQAAREMVAVCCVKCSKQRLTAVCREMQVQCFRQS